MSSNAAPHGGFYAAMTSEIDAYGPYVRFLVGPFPAWEAANEWLPKAESLIRKDFTITNDTAHFEVAYFQCATLPCGVLNGKLWVDKSKLVS